MQALLEYAPFSSFILCFWKRAIALSSAVRELSSSASAESQFSITLTDVLKKVSHPWASRAAYMERQHNQVSMSKIRRGLPPKR